jgi:hypothetical protein
MSINSVKEYRILEPGTFRGLDLSTGRMPTDEVIRARKELEKLERLAELAARCQLEEHPDKVYGQVVVNGKVFATVYDSGGATTERTIPGLSADGAGISLAKTRLNEIAKAVHGQIRYSNFLPHMGGSFARGVENPALEVARRRVEALQHAMFEDWARTRLNLSAPVESTAAEQKSS